VSSAVFSALERDRVQPVRERAQLRARLGDLLARDSQQPPRLRRVAAVELAAGDVEELAERDQPLLRAVVEVAPDPLALLVGRLEHLGARGDQRALALAQPALLLAPLELSADPRGEDLQRRELVRARVQRLLGGHREVADRPPVTARAGDGEVAVEAVLDQERVLGEGGRDARLVAHDRALVQQLAGRALELVLPAGGQRLGRPRGQRARPLPAVAQLRDPAHAAAERLAHGLHEPLQELLSDHARGACRHGAQEVLARRVDRLGHLS
jgi:hypothetical protein